MVRLSFCWGDREGVIEMGRQTSGTRDFGWASKKMIEYHSGRKDLGMGNTVGTWGRLDTIVIIILHTTENFVSP